MPTLALDAMQRDEHGLRHGVGWPLRVDGHDYRVDFEPSMSHAPGVPHGCFTTYPSEGGEAFHRLRAWFGWRQTTTEYNPLPMPNGDVLLEILARDHRWPMLGYLGRKNLARYIYGIVDDAPVLVRYESPPGRLGSRSVGGPMAAWCETDELVARLQHGSRTERLAALVALESISVVGFEPVEELERPESVLRQAIVELADSCDIWVQQQAELLLSR